MDKILSDANPGQKSAITAPYMPVMIIAGPGTGKTKTLTARIAYLMSKGADPTTIVALTFTRKAAQEMDERLQKHIHTESKPIIATFHALCLAILREERKEDVQFASESERLQAIKAAVAAAGQKGLSAREASLIISRAKGSMATSSQSEALVKAYNEALHAGGRIDFDDIISDTYRLLRSNTHALHRQRDRFQHILIDEFQDTSEQQWRLVQLLRGSESIFVIGDPKQSIYGFRGLSQDMFALFRAEFPACKEVVLDTNYRSHSAIVLLANAVFPGEQALRAHHATSGSVRTMQTLNEYSEADVVLRIIEEGIGGTTFLTATSESRGWHFRDFAILYRTHRAAKAVEKRLHDSGIPYQVVGEGSPYEQPEVRSLIESLTWLSTAKSKKGDAPSAPGLNAHQVRALLNDIAIEAPPSQIAHTVAEKLNLAADDPKKEARLAQCIGMLVRFPTLEACVAYFEAIAGQDFYDPQADAVTLLIIHAAKGLEFTNVIVLAAEEGMLPHIRKSEEPDIDEERRLFYVAITRAKQDLTIMYTKKRGGEPSTASRFVVALSERLLPRQVDPSLDKTEKRMHKRAQKARQATLF